MSNVKNLIETAEAKLNSIVTDIEDLTISKNHKVNILDVAEEIRVAQRILNEAVSLISRYEATKQNQGATSRFKYETRV